MIILCEEVPNCLVVSVSGRLDTLTSPDLDKAGKGWIEGGRIDVVLDLNELDYISSAGLRSVLALAKAIEANGGRIVLSGAKGMVQEVLSMSGFDSFLRILPDLDGAISFFR